MGDFNLPNEDWAQFTAITTAKICATEKFLTAKNVTQLITEQTQNDENVLELVFTTMKRLKFHISRNYQLFILFSAYLRVSLKTLIPWLHKLTSSNTVWLQLT